MSLATTPECLFLGDSKPRSVISPSTLRIRRPNTPGLSCHPGANVLVSLSRSHVIHVSILSLFNSIHGRCQTCNHFVYITLSILTQRDITYV